MIKGIVPSELKNGIQKITNNKQASGEVLGIMYDHLYKLINDFWKERCIKVLHHEQVLGITSAQKKAISSNANNFQRSYYVDHDIYDNMEDKIEGSSILDQVVTFNSHFANFWRSLDFFSFFSVANIVRFLRLL